MVYLANFNRCQGLCIAIGFYAIMCASLRYRWGESAPLAHIPLFCAHPAVVIPASVSTPSLLVLFPPQVSQAKK